MNRLGLMTCLGAALALPACIVDHGLGETAEDTGSGDHGSGTYVPPDPSATSGQPPTATSGGTEDPPDPSVGTDPSATDGGSETDTEGELECEQDPEHVRWQHNGESFSPLLGLDASFAAILTGDCLVADLHAYSQDNDATMEITLDCSLSGRIDGDAMASGDFMIELQLAGTALGTAYVVDVFEALILPAQQVRLSVVLDWWGMGWNSWLVITDLEGAPLLDVLDAEHVDPTSSTWGMEVADMLAGEPWHRGMAVGTTASECGGPITKCNDEPMAITVGWIEESPLVLHPYQEGIIGTPFPEQQMGVSVTSAHQTPMPTCTDMPLASYAMTAWAVTP